MHSIIQEEEALINWIKPIFVEHRFKEITHQPEGFFNTLPADWSEGIEPYWEAYKDTARIFVLETDSEIVGGGIVFSTPSPDTHPAYSAKAESWFKEGYLYIGFLWISEQHRDKKLGSRWLQEVFAVLPNHRFWLSIEEFALAAFYIRNGFDVINKLEVDGSEEWVLVRPAQKPTGTHLELPRLALAV